MKQQTFIHIPEPCHENWDAMTPESRGRFCASCAKTVVDFTTMTDTQVLNYLNTIKGNTCGRFNDDQLERAMQEEEKKKKNKWQWIMAALAAFIYTNKSAAQANTAQPKPIAAEHKEPDTIMFLGMVASRIVPEDKKNITIKGVVKDIEGMPLQNAAITIDGSARINTDAYGEFTLTKPKNRSKSTLEVSYVGNKTEKVVVNYADTTQPLVITLTPEDTRLQDVVVQSSPTILKGKIVAGGISVKTSISKTDTLFADCRKSIGLSNVYPNPAIKNSKVNIKIKDAGDYNIQMFSTNGVLISQQMMKDVFGKYPLPFTIPASIAAGNYYLRIINNTTKKQSTEKIVVM